MAKPLLRLLNEPIYVGMELCSALCLPGSLQLCCLLPPPQSCSSTRVKSFEASQQTRRLALDSHHTQTPPQRGDGYSPFPLLCPPVTPFPPRNSSGVTPATLTLLLAKAASNECVAWLTSPKFPKTTPAIFPKLTSFCSTLPTSPSGTPWRRSAALAFLSYSP